MADGLRISFDTKALEAELDNITAKAEEFVRPAAQAGAAVLYGEVKLRVPVGEKPHIFYGTHQRYRFEAGALRDSIYQVFSKDNSGNGRATYHVAWNHRKAPYGFMVEFGTSRAPAHPFLRPAYDAAKDLSLTVANDKFAELMERALPGIRK